jgi:predicted DNA-binding transcriptional regulator AlpA
MAIAVSSEHVSIPLDPDFVTERELAQQLGCSYSTVRLWRARGKGPAFHKIGGRVVYRISSDVCAWLNGTRVPSPRARRSNHGR